MLRYECKNAQVLINFDILEVLHYSIHANIYDLEYINFPCILNRSSHNQNHIIIIFIGFIFFITFLSVLNNNFKNTQRNKQNNVFGLNIFNNNLRMFQLHQRKFCSFFMFCIFLLSCLSSLWVFIKNKSGNVSENRLINVFLRNVERYW